MALRVGIIGLPNVGKSTLLNALTSAGAEASNYPFTTIDRNIGVAAVPDPRLEMLAQRLHPKEVTPATVEFVDIAGLVRGASQGEGLGNAFLAHIREMDVLIHVVRCFPGEEVVHVHGQVDPVADFQVVETELLLADADRLKKQMDRIRKQAKAHPEEAKELLAAMEDMQRRLDAGEPARRWPEPLRRLLREDERLADLHLLTDKKLVVVANVSEGNLDGEPWVSRLREAVTAEVEVIPIPVKLEAELAELDPQEREAFLRELGLAERGLERLVRTAARLLGLITFYTIANEKLRAWHIPKGTRAIEAAGRIHTDMAKGFIRMEVMSCSDILEHGSRAELHKRGLVRVEGKDYEVQDGDVCQVLFKV
jgi:hypothetical protein